MKTRTKELIDRLKRISSDDLVIHLLGNAVVSIIAEAADSLEELSQERQDKQEPVAWASPNVISLRGGKDNHPAILTLFKCNANTVPLYTAPPKRKPLSDEEIKAIGNSINKYETLENGKLIFARAIEKAHGIGVGND